MHASKKNNIEWDNSNTPVCVECGDVYYPKSGGLTAAEEVFLKLNLLPERLLLSQNFHIGELGFGTGLNLFALLYNIEQMSQNCNANLYFTSVEYQPLEFEIIEKALSSWPQIKCIAHKFERFISGLKPGINTYAQYPNLHLTVIVEDINSAFSKFGSLPVDAWFLDGFNPAKNPAMWTEEVFRNMANHSYENTTLSTWCVAGHVRRNLASAGFTVEKVPGSGGKREHLRGKFRGEG